MNHLQANTGKGGTLALVHLGCQGWISSEEVRRFRHRWVVLHRGGLDHTQWCLGVLSDRDPNLLVLIRQLRIIVQHGCHDFVGLWRYWRRHLLVHQHGLRLREVVLYNFWTDKGVVEVFTRVHICHAVLLRLTWPVDSRRLLCACRGKHRGWDSGWLLADDVWVFIDDVGTASPAQSLCVVLRT